MPVATATESAGRSAADTSVCDFALRASGARFTHQFSSARSQVLRESFSFMIDPKR